MCTDRLRIIGSELIIKPRARDCRADLRAAHTHIWRTHRPTFTAAGCRSVCARARRSQPPAGGFLSVFNVFLPQETEPCRWDATRATRYSCSDARACTQTHLWSGCFCPCTSRNKTQIRSLKTTSVRGESGSPGPQHAE